MDRLALASLLNGTLQYGQMIRDGCLGEVKDRRSCYFLWFCNVATYVDEPISNDVHMEGILLIITKNNHFILFI